MGLPLFIAPVESDVKPKPSNKSGVTSPSRSSIRRNPALPDRERRARRNVRIQAAVNRAYPTGTEGVSDSSGDRLTGARRAGFRVHNSEAGRSLDRVSSTIPSARYPGLPFEANWLEPNVSMSELERRPFRNALREITQSNDPQQRRRWEEQMDEIFGGNWQDAPRSYSRGVSPRETDHVSYMRRRESRRMSPWQRAPRYSPEDSGLLSLFNSTSQGAFNDPAAPPTLRSFRVDGLGDRQRSPSPERDWDTLLSTLTPDPQAPSANSSFASAPTSRNNGVSATSSHTTPPIDPARVPPFDPHCEEGRENTDDDDGPDSWRTRLPPAPWRRSTSTHQNSSSRHPTQPAVDDYFPPLQRFPGDLDEHASPSDTDQAEHGSQLRRQRDREREQRAEASGTGTDEEWSGMQHIVRRLANRDDIPDEWWAEVGLSRTLPRDEGNV